MKKYIVCLLLSAGSLIGAETPKPKSFLDGISLSPEAVYRLDISNNSQEWGAALSLSANLNKYVRLNIRGIGYESQDWGGTAIDEVQPGVTFQLLSGSKVTLDGEVNYTRSFRFDDNGIGVGGRLSYNFTKNVALFGGAQYRVFNKQQNDVPILGGLKFSF